MTLEGGEWLCRWCNASWPEGQEHTCEQLEAANVYAAQQLHDWVEGRPHCQEPFDCCPDLSCCSGGPMAPQEERERFVRATDRERDEMLLVFLGRAMAIARPDGGVHIAGREE